MLTELHRWYARLSGRSILYLSILLNVVVFVRVAVINSPYLSYEGPSGFDRVYYYAYARSIVIDHDVDFTNEFAMHPPSDRIATSNGRPINKYPSGTALVALPAFAATHLVLRIAHAAGAPVSIDGYSAPYAMSFALSELFAACLGMWLLYRTLTRYVAEPSAGVAVAVGWCGTFAFHYTAVDLMMSHAAAQFSTAWCAYEAVTLGSSSDRLVKWCRLGASSALVVLVRNQNAVFLLVPAAAALVALWRDMQLRRVGAIALKSACAGGALLVCVIPQLLMWRQMYGTVILNSYGREANFKWVHPSMLRVLSDPARGLLLWVPVLALGLGGAVVWAVRKRDAIGLAAVASWMLNFYVICSYWGWQSVARRATFDMPFPLALGLAVVADRVSARRPLAVAALALVAIAWNLPFASMGVPQATATHSVWVGWLTALRLLI